MNYHHDKGVKGAASTSWSKNFPTHSLILTSIMWLTGLTSTTKGIKARNAGAGGGTLLKKTKSVGGASKNCRWLPWCLISKSPAPGHDCKQTWWAVKYFPMIELLQDLFATHKEFVSFSSCWKKALNFPQYNAQLAIIRCTRRRLSKKHDYPVTQVLLSGLFILLQGCQFWIFTS